MNTKEIKDLLKLVSELDLKEVKIKNKEFELKIRTDKDQQVNVVSGGGFQAQPGSFAPVAPQQPAVAPATVAATPAEETAEAKNNYIEVKSPMVGTFYRSAAPEKPAYVQVGDTIAVGQVVCIIEAMKLFNEIESEVSGTIVKVLIDDSSPVEYDQVLFLVEPNA